MANRRILTQGGDAPTDSFTYRIDGTAQVDRVERPERRFDLNGAVALVDPGDLSDVIALYEFGLCWLPVPAGGDLGGGPLVPAVRPVLPGRRGAAGRAGITVDHVSIYRWVQRFTPEFIEAARPCRRAPGRRWFVDETF